MRNVRVLVLFAVSSLSFAQTPRGPEFPVSVETQPDPDKHGSVDVFACLFRRR